MGDLAGELARLSQEIALLKSQVRDLVRYLPSAEYVELPRLLDASHQSLPSGVRQDSSQTKEML